MSPFKKHVITGRPLKLSILVPALSRGGMTRAYWLAYLARQSGYDVQIIGSLLEHEAIYPAPPTGLQITAVPHARFTQLVRRLVKRIEGDVVYAVKPKANSFGVALLSRIVTRKPVLLDIDDWETWHYKSEIDPTAPGQSLNGGSRVVRDYRRKLRELRQPDSKLYTRRLEQLTGLANALTVNNRYLQGRFGGVYLPSGKDTSIFDPAAFDADRSRARYGLSAYRVLMFPGTPVAHKGLEDVLIAVERLAWPDLRLVLVGGRAVADSYRRWLLERWGRWIITLPGYPLETMPDVISAAHVVVIAQRDVPVAWAQCPMKLTDGMAMAKPIICTRVGEIAAVIGDTGYLVAPSSPGEIAVQIEAIFADLESAQAQGMRARARCVERYSVGALAPVFAELVGGCAGRMVRKPMSATSPAQP